MKMPWELAERDWKVGDPPIGVKNRDHLRSRGWLRRHVGRRCPYCGLTMTRERGWNSQRAPSRDHCIPLSRGGANTLANMIVCCRRCNEDKGSLTQEEYLAVLAGLASRLDHITQARRSREMNPQNARRDPLVRAVLNRFPGAEIVAVNSSKCSQER